MVMKTYARVAEGVVAEVVLLDASLDVAAVFNAALTFVDVTNASPQPQQGWRYTAPSIFTAPGTLSATPAQQTQAALAAGLTITSTGAPALNATYAVDPVTQAKITAVSVYILKNTDFPGGVSTFQWPDITGTLRTFPSANEFEAFATAVANYVVALDLIMLTNAGSLPAATATIA